MDLNPHHSDSLNNKGLVLWEQGKTNDALNAFVGALKEDSNNMGACKNLARAYLAKERPDDAIGLLENLRRSAARDPDLLSTLGDAWMDKGRFNKALRYYRQSLRREKDSRKKSSLLVRIGLVYERDGKRSRALKAFSKALSQSEDAAFRQGLKKRIDEIKSSGKE